MEGMLVKEKVSEDGQTILAASLQLENRKAVAKRLGLTPNKTNSAKIDEEQLRMRDALKVAAFGEFSKLAASENWTGNGFKITATKSGSTATMSLKSVDRNASLPSAENVAKALANMTPEQGAALVAKGVALKAGKVAINLEAETAPAAE